MSNYYVTSKSAVLLPGRIIAVPGQEVDASIFDCKGGPRALQNLLDEGCLKPFQTVELDPTGIDTKRARDLPSLPLETEEGQIRGISKGTAKIDRRLEEIERKQEAARKAEEAKKGTDWKAKAKARQETLERLASGGPDENEIDLEQAKALGLVK